jgi:hypothetical protein
LGSEHSFHALFLLSVCLLLLLLLLLLQASQS